MPLLSWDIDVELNTLSAEGAELTELMAVTKLWLGYTRLGSITS